MVSQHSVMSAVSAYSNAVADTGCEKWCVPPRGSAFICMPQAGTLKVQYCPALLAQVQNQSTLVVGC